jgi:hypothetical protein
MISWTAASLAPRRGPGSNAVLRALARWLGRRFERREARLFGH